MILLYRKSQFYSVRAHLQNINLLESFDRMLHCVVILIMHDVGSNLWWNY